MTPFLHPFFFGTNFSAFTCFLTFCTSCIKSARSDIESHGESLLRQNSPGYPCQLWDSCTKYGGEELQDVQKFACKVCLGKWDIPYDEMNET